MSYGYSLRLVQLNRAAKSSLLGVRLGRLCIQHNVPVSVVADRCKVSRPTVYNWFIGVSNPSESNIGIVEEMISELE